MRRRSLILALLGLVAIAAVVNATVFAYRTLFGHVKVVDITSGQNQSTITQYGLACTGFYIKGVGSGTDTVTDDTGLPNAGTNSQDTSIANPGNGKWYGVKVVLGNEACSYTNTSSGHTNTLYETADVYINVTNGAWYFKDILGFGYPTGFTPSPIYVMPAVSQTLSNTNITYAYLLIMNASTGDLIAKVDLKSGNVYDSSGSQLSSPITLNSGQGLRIDLDLCATGEVNLDEFTVQFYVSAKNETP
jgi:hypothetical protein